MIVIRLNRMNPSDERPSLRSSRRPLLAVDGLGGVTHALDR